MRDRIRCRNLGRAVLGMPTEHSLDHDGMDMWHCAPYGTPGDHSDNAAFDDPEDAIEAAWARLRCRITAPAESEAQDA